MSVWNRNDKFSGKISFLDIFVEMKLTRLFANQNTIHNSVFNSTSKLFQLTPIPPDEVQLVEAPGVQWRKLSTAKVLPSIFFPHRTHTYCSIQDLSQSVNRMNIKCCMDETRYTFRLNELLLLHSHLHTAYFNMIIFTSTKYNCYANDRKNVEIVSSLRSKMMFSFRKGHSVDGCYGLVIIQLWGGEKPHHMQLVLFVESFAEICSGPKWKFSRLRW